MKKVFLLTLLLCSSAAYAQGTANTPQPVEISAAKSLEWDRKAKTYTAHENVTVTQGTVRIQSDRLTARYTDDKGMTDISTLEADNHVVISSPPYTATGDKGVYNVKTGNATLTGNDLKITTDDTLMTAEDKIEFFGNENKLTATGKATAARGGDVLSANVLNAYFVKDAQGRMSASKITATGGVTIKTEKETATGDSGTYDLPAQKAVLTGHVRIYQGENWLEGTRADIDMATGLSRLSGSGSNTDTEGRVKGVFYPKSQQKPEGEKQ